MTRDPKWRRPVLRRTLALAALLCCLPLSGCNLLIDEFTWLDRVPPPAAEASAEAAADS